jgi:cytochrome o ubiquinol oxidase subunit 3
MSEADASVQRVAKAAEHYEADSKSLFGFWIYLMTDCVLFASLFATYAVLHNNIVNGPGATVLFSLPYALAETVILLSSSYSAGLAVMSARLRKKNPMMAWFGVTFILGASFLSLELHEFSKLAHAGNSWTRSGFLSSYFTLVGTHGLHITVGLIWMLIMFYRVSKQGLGRHNLRQVTMLSYFWHFLDVIWIFIFTIVYLLGGLGV